MGVANTKVGVAPNFTGAFICPYMLIPEVGKYRQSFL